MCNGFSCLQRKNRYGWRTFQEKPSVGFVLSWWSEADQDHKRWTIETLFQTVEQTLQSELSTLGYPKATLFGFAVALCAYNIYAVVQAALAARWGQATVREDVSAYYVADEIRAVQGGMDIALDDEAWAPFHTLLPDELARQLVEMAGRVQLARFCKTKRGPKKPVPPRTRYSTTPHVSTARLLVRRAGGDWS